MKNKTSYLIALFAIVSLLSLTLGPLIYGLILAYKASFILFVIVLIMFPASPILGWIALLGHPDICHKIVYWLHLPI
jgi:predicted ABC-type exoprotein transport system permease subunit